VKQGNVPQVGLFVLARPNMCSDQIANQLERFEDLERSGPIFGGEFGDDFVEASSHLMAQLLNPF